MSAPTCVLVINAGSSSLKYQLIDLATSEALGSGLIEKIGEPSGIVTHKNADGKHTAEQVFRNHEDAFQSLLANFENHGPKLADHPLLAVGHRVVHGGTKFADPALITDDLLATVTELIPLAPLHNPPNLEGIKVAREVFGDVPQVAVFDTAFHQSMPAKAYTYAVPQSWEQEHMVRRYGFHGTSHAFVSRSAAELLGKDPSEANVIVMHVGNGASASAVAGGKCIDTSMGLTPLEGLIMGTRPGDVDPGLAAYMMGKGLTPAEYDRALNKESGLKALYGSNDYRDIEAGIDAGDERAKLTMEMAAYRIRKYLGAYTFALGTVDAVAFTAGAGENGPLLRSLVCRDLQAQGIELDEDLNNTRSSQPRIISTPASRVAVMVIPTNEELEIAIQARAVVNA